VTENGRTFSQKALARAAGLTEVAVGQVVDARPDVVLSHDNTAAIRRIWLEFRQQRVANRSGWRSRWTTPYRRRRRNMPRTMPRCGRSCKSRVLKTSGKSVAAFAIRCLVREAAVLPGQLILGADSHTTHYGWMGAFGAGIGRSEVAVLWATGELWLRVPESIHVVLQGQLPPWVTAKDFALRLIGDLGADGGLYATIEFSGSGIAELSLASRMVLPNMMAEFGAKSAYIAPDDATFDYLARRRLARLHRLRGEARDALLARHAAEPAGLPDIMGEIRASALFPDASASYTAVHTYRAEDLEPFIACPHSVDNVVPLSQIAGTRVHQAFLGTCTNGRLEDLEIAARIVGASR